MRLPKRIAERLGPLDEGPFRLLWLGQTTSAIGDSLIPVAIAFAVLPLGGATAVGLVLASFTLPRVILILVGGVWADRLPRQLVMVAADVIRGAVELALAFLLLSGVAQLWELAAGAALIGAASAFFVPASTGLTPQTISPGRLQQGNALISLSRSATGIIGPSVSGLLVAAVGPGWVFVIDAATYGASAVSLVALRIVHSVTPEARQGFLAELAGGWREVVSRRWLTAAIVTFGFSNVAMAPFYVLGPAIANDRLGGAAGWGLIVTAMGLGGLLGGLVALRWKPSRPLAAGFLLGLSFSLPMLALAPPLPVAFIMLAGLLSLAAVELGNTWWYTVLQQRIPPQALSRVSSYDWLASIVFQPIGFSIAGPIAALVSAPVTLVGAALLSLGANLTVLTVRDVRKLGWVEHAPASAASLPQAEGPMAGPIELD
ncbi:MAG: MFS transporter [Chloroflexota bacterium]|nr:MFS transporter [Chloroflexota bacterium]